MLKSFSSSKRPSTSCTQVQNHKCYFHDSYFISKFCTNKKCTLPLCQKCIPIHVKQHLKEEHILGKENIIPFSSAYDIAIQNIQTLISTKTQNTVSISQKLQYTKKQIENLIQKEFSKIEEKISEQQNEIKIVSEKFNKIKKGSLKTLIFYFSDEQILKSNAETFSSEQSKLSQILLLIQKLKNTFKSLFNQSDKSNSCNVQNPVRSNLVPKYEDYPLKTSSHFPLEASSNNLVYSNPQTLQIKGQSQYKKPLKFQSSSDFSSLLKDHKSRLESVRNKNLSFAMNYASENRQSACKKIGSQSVDNFYFTRNPNERSYNKEQNQTRPLQISSKNFNHSTVKGLSPKMTEINSDSKEKLSKIKQKYIGGIVLSKENIKTETKGQVKTQKKSGSKYSNKETSILRRTQTQQTKSKDLENRILSREEIRVNIQNRLNQRSASLMAPSDKQRPNLINHILTQKGKQSFSNQKINQTFKQPFGKDKIEQFTLNKNYQFGESYQTLITEMDKVPMSSIKKELRAEPFEKNEPAIKKFFQENPQKYESFNVRDERLPQNNHILKIKDEITKFVVDKKSIENEENRKAKIIHQQKIRNEPSKKDLMYDEAKQSIKLNEPNSRSENETRQNSESKRKEGKRFNYLYEIDQQTQIIINSKI